MNLKNNRQNPSKSRLERKRSTKTMTGDPVMGMESLSRSIFEETPSLFVDGRIQEDEIIPIIELEQNNLSRYADGEVWKGDII